MIALVLLIIAVVLLLLAAINAPSQGRVSWGWMGLFFYLLSLLVTRSGVH